MRATPPDIAHTLIKRKRTLVFFASVLPAIEIRQHPGECPARIRLAARISYRAIALDRGGKVHACGIALAKTRLSGGEFQERVRNQTRRIMLLCLTQVRSPRGRHRPFESSTAAARRAAASSVRASPATSGSRRRSSSVRCACRGFARRDLGVDLVKAILGIEGL